MNSRVDNPTHGSTRRGVKGLTTLNDDTSLRRDDPLGGVFLHGWHLMRRLGHLLQNELEPRVGVLVADGPVQVPDAKLVMLDPLPNM